MRRGAVSYLHISSSALDGFMLMAVTDRHCAWQSVTVMRSGRRVRRFSFVTDISGLLQFLKCGGHNEVEQVGHRHPIPCGKGRQLAEVCLGNPGLRVSSVTHNFACSL